MGGGGVEEMTILEKKENFQMRLVWEVIFCWREGGLVDDIQLTNQRHDKVLENREGKVSVGKLGNIRKLLQITTP